MLGMIRKASEGNIPDLVKTGLSILSFAVLIAYVDLPDKFSGKDPQINRKALYMGIFCTLGALEVYGFNYFRFIYVQPIAQKITVERWITVSPGTVCWIIGAHSLAALLYVVALSCACGVFMGILLVGLGYLIVCDLFCYVPI
jgi:hypothetical protein